MQQPSSWRVILRLATVQAPALDGLEAGTQCADGCPETPQHEAALEDILGLASPDDQSPTNTSSEGAALEYVWPDTLLQRTVPAIVWVLFLQNGAGGKPGRCPFFRLSYPIKSVELCPECKRLCDESSSIERVCVPCRQRIDSTPPSNGDECTLYIYKTITQQGLERKLQQAGLDAKALQSQDFPVDGPLAETIERARKPQRKRKVDALDTLDIDGAFTYSALTAGNYPVAAERLPLETFLQRIPVAQTTANRTAGAGALSLMNEWRVGNVPDIWGFQYDGVYGGAYWKWFYIEGGVPKSGKSEGRQKQDSRFRGCAPEEVSGHDADCKRTEDEQMAWAASAIVPAATDTSPAARAQSPEAAWDMSSLTVALKETFSTAFETNYSDKLIVISEGGGKVLNREQLKDWLETTAREELANYQTNDDGFIEPIIAEGNVVGGLLYSWHAEEGTIYLGQIFVHPDFERRGLASRLLDTKLPDKHEGLRRYEALHRCGNDKGRSFFQEKHAFLPDWSLVVKYGYSPDLYVGVYKNLA